MMGTCGQGCMLRDSAAGVAWLLGCVLSNSATGVPWLLLGILWLTNPSRWPGSCPPHHLRKLPGLVFGCHGPPPSNGS